MSESNDPWSIVKSQKHVGKERSPTSSEEIMSEGNNSEYSLQIYEEADILSSTSGDTNSDIDRVIDQVEMDHMAALLSSGPPLDQSNLTDLAFSGNVENTIYDSGFQSNSTLRDHQIGQLSNSVAMQRTISNGKRTLDNDDTKEYKIGGREETETDTAYSKEQDSAIETDIVKKKAKMARKRANKRKTKKARLSQQTQENIVSNEPFSAPISKELEPNSSEEDTKHNITMDKEAVLETSTYSHSTTPITEMSNKIKPSNTINENQSTKHRNKNIKDETTFITSEIFGALILFLALLGTWKFISLFIAFIKLYRDNPFSTFSGKEIIKFDWNIEPNEMISGTNTTSFDFTKTHSFESSLYIFTKSLEGEDKLSTEFWKPHGKYLIDFDSEEIYKLDITEMMLNWYDGVIEESKNHYGQFRSLVTKEMNRDSERWSLVKAYLNNMTTRASCNAQSINIKAKCWLNKYQEKIFHI